MEQAISPTGRGAEQPSAAEPDPFARFQRPGYALTPGNSRLETWLFDHLWFIWALTFGLILITAQLGRLPEAELGWPMTDWNLGWSTLWLLTPCFLALAATIVLFKNFVRHPPQTFASLSAGGQLRAKPSITGGPSAATIENQLKSPARFLFPIAGWLLYLPVLFYSGVPQRTLPQLQSAGLTITQVPAVIWVVAVFIIAPFTWTYLIGVLFWMLVVVARHLQRLPETFGLNIDPFHLDRCGGLQPIGDLCLHLAAFCLVFALVPSFWALFNVFDETNQVVGPGALLLSVALLLFAYLIFFVPMWSTHQEMLRARRSYQDEASHRTSPSRHILRQLLGGARTPEVDRQIQEVTIELAALERVYPPELSYPTWPVNASIRLTFLTAQIIPIITVAIAIIQLANSS